MPGQGYENIKNELKQYTRLTEEVEDLKERISDLRLSSIRSPKLDGMPKSQRDSDPIGSAVIRIESLEKQLMLYESKLFLIESEISSVRDTNKRIALRYRYIDRLPWQMIADQMNYSIQHVYRLHKEALEEIAQNESN